MIDNFIVDVLDERRKSQHQQNTIFDILGLHSMRVFYGVADVFDILNRTPQIIADSMRVFIDNFENDLDDNKKDETKRTALGSKFLADQLLIKPPTAPVCLHRKSSGKIKIAKGNKKLNALMLINAPVHPVIITSAESIEGFDEIRSDLELYSVLRQLDPTAEKFYVKLIIAEDGSLYFHYMSDEKKATEWVNVQQCEQDYRNFGPSEYPMHVGLVNAVSNDKRLIGHAIGQTISSREDLESVHASMIDRVPDYLCTIYSKRPISIIPEYINLVSSNLFLRQRISCGYTHDVNDFASNDIVIRFNWDGIAGRIPNFY